MHTCPKCRIEQPDSHFPVSKRTGKPVGWCRQCKARTMTIWRRSNPEAAKVAQKRDNDRRKVRPKDPVPEEKRCPGCGKVKPADDFGRDQRTSTGLRTRCKRCVTDASLAWNRANPDKFRRNQRASVLRRRYGVSVDEYDAMLAAQDGVCAICQQLPYGTRLHVDHCHATFTVRGLLCFRCNTMLGHLDDDPALLHRAIEYLQRAERSLEAVPLDP